MKIRIAGVILALGGISTAFGQIGNYLGPGVLSRGAGTVGSRGGQQVNLRVGGSVGGFYDNGLVPIAVDDNGALLRPGAAYGVEAALFAYGTHQWRTAQLGLNYNGNYRHYTQNSFYNGTDQSLVLGYTVQKSRRLVFDMRQIAGTIARANNGFIGSQNMLLTDAFDPSTSLLFDSRATFIQSGLDVTYLKSARTSFRAGGSGYAVYRRNKALVGVNGYTLQGDIQHRLSQVTTIGVTYSHMHYDFPRAFGEADINMYQGTFARQLGRLWTFSVQGGMGEVEAQGLQRIQLDPAVAAIIGVSSGVQAFYRKSRFPTGSAALIRRFKSASLGFNYTRSFNPGNGVYLTSRTESGGVSYSYSGFRNWGFSATAAYASMTGIGQTVGFYRTMTGGVGVTRNLTRNIQAIARYDLRHQELDAANFLRNSSRVTFSLAFSPADVPLSLW